jgi:hypothetical protein
MAGHLVAGAELDERRHHAFAGAGDGHRTARREGAARREVAGVRWLAADDRTLP